MTQKFVYYRNTKDRCDDEQEAEVMEQADNDKEAIEYDEFVKQVEGFDEITKPLGYSDDDLPVKDDWSVSFNQSKYGGLPCLIFCHTECDFVFLRPDDAKMLAEAFASGKDPVEWVRATSFGKGGAFDKAIDPTADKFADDNN